MLRAGQNGNLRILIPMITSLDEITQVKNIIEVAKRELKKRERNMQKLIKLEL